MKSLLIYTLFVYGCGSVAVGKMIRLLTMSFIVAVAFVQASPTIYKKNEQNLYEPGELVVTRKK